MSRVTNEKSLPSKLPVVETNVETTFADRLLESVKPHANLILLGLAAIFLLFIALAWMMQSRARVAEGEWMSLNQAFAIANMTGNTSTIREVAEDYPDGIAGLWGLMLAGDYELRRGLEALPTNQTEGIREIERAKNTLKKIVDAPASRKTPLLQVRSTFSLAYAYESLGDFENAQSLYKQIVDQAPDSAFAQAAKRGLDRSTNPAFVTVFERFKEWQDPYAVAPGELPSEKPEISFPEIPEDEADAPAENAEGDQTPAENTDPDQPPQDSNSNTQEEDGSVDF
jgi:tetratricopeptide (TPR) repeat protein